MKALRRQGVDVFHNHELAVFVTFGAALVHKILTTSTAANNDADSSAQVAISTLKNLVQVTSFQL